MLRPVGKPENFYVHDAYVHRLDNKHFDDRQFKDEWQREVYEEAARIAAVEGSESVVDIGCGSGYKLITYLGHLRTLGVDLEPAYSFVKEVWPDSEWMLADWEKPLPFIPDLLISADVIEHLVNPDVLLDYIEKSAARYVVLSTPDLGFLKLDTEDGPPRNHHHVREWNMPQFAAYIGSRFNILNHFRTEEGSQVVVAELRG